MFARGKYEPWHMNSSSCARALPWQQTGQPFKGVFVVKDTLVEPCYTLVPPGPRAATYFGACGRKTVVWAREKPSTQALTAESTLFDDCKVDIHQVHIEVLRVCAMQRAAGAFGVHRGAHQCSAPYDTLPRGQSHDRDHHHGRLPRHWCVPFVYTKRQ